MLTRTRTPLVAALALALAGCVTIQMPEVSQTHPANPDAAATPAPDIPFELNEPVEPVVAPPLSTSGKSSEPKPMQMKMDGDDAAMQHQSALMEPAQPSGEELAEAGYVCPMHPDVVRNEPGSCPECGMDLVPPGDEA